MTAIVFLRAVRSINNGPSCKLFLLMMFVSVDVFVAFIVVVVATVAAALVVAEIIPCRAKAF